MTSKPTPQTGENHADEAADDIFTTDVSETSDEGTEVYEADVRKDDLSEVKRKA